MRVWSCRTIPVVFILMVLCSAAASAGAAEQSFSDEQVQEAIDKAVEYLYSRQNEDGSWPDASGGLHREEEDRQIGLTSLVVYALLETGERLTDPRIGKALAWLESRDTGWTYAVAMRSQVWLSAYRNSIGQDKAKYRRLLKADAWKAVQAVNGHPKEPGNYGYRLTPNTGENGKKQQNNGLVGRCDHSNAQYAVLAVWAAKQANLEVPTRYWRIVMEHWMSAQDSSGGWGYRPNDKVTATMTAGGVATMFVCVDATMHGQFTRCGRPTLIPSIEKGLAWFEKHAEESIVQGKHQNHPYYYLYGLERVGLAAGYKFFGKADWYKLGVEYLLKNQKNGGWGGKHGTDTSTSFALLFLIRGQRPVLLSRLEHSGDWNNRPRALANLTEWFTDGFEGSFNWQIVNLKVDVQDLHDSPILLISGSKKLEFNDEELDKLRTLVWQGGTILSVTECNGAAFSRSMREVYKKLFPKYELVPVPSDHPIYSISARLKGQPKLYMVFNGVRPIALHSDGDLVLPWQMRQDTTRKQEFDAAANIVMYITDKRFRNRGVSAWPAEPGRSASRTVKIARIQHNGNPNPEPLAYERFRRQLQTHAGIGIEILDLMPAAKLTPETAPLAVLTGTNTFHLSEADENALKAYVDGGGVLLVTPAGGAMGGGRKFAGAAESLLQKLYGLGAMRPLAMLSPLYSRSDAEIKEVAYRRITALKLGRSKNPNLRAMIDAKGRPTVIYSPEDIIAGLAGVTAADIDGYDPGRGSHTGSAYDIMRNIVLMAGDVPEGQVRASK